MSRHNFKTRDNDVPTDWDMEFGGSVITVTLKQQQRDGAYVVLHTELTPAQAEDLREMLQLYQNQRRRLGKADR